MFCPKCGNQNPDGATFCVKCGASMAQKTQSAAQTSNNVQSQSNNAKNDLIDIFSSDAQTEAAYAGVSEYGRYTKGARTMRLVVGIIAIVLQLFIVLQSCGAGFVNSILAPKTAAGSAGLVMSLSMLTAGIISIAARKTQGGTITAAVFFMFGAVICKIDVGLFKDLIVWSYVSLIFAVLLIISLAMKEDTSYDRNYTDAIVLGVAAGAVLIGMIAYDATHKDTDGSAVKAQIESGLNEMKNGMEKALGYWSDDYNNSDHSYDYDYDDYYGYDYTGYTVATAKPVETTETTTTTTVYVDPYVSFDMMGNYEIDYGNSIATLDKDGDSFTMVIENRNMSNYSYNVASGVIDSWGEWFGDATVIIRSENSEGGYTFTNNGSQTMNIKFFPSEDAFVINDEHKFDLTYHEGTDINLHCKVKIDDGYLNVRDKSTTKGNVIGKLHKNDEVIVIDWVDGDTKERWGAILYDGENIGFARSDFLS